MIYKKYDFKKIFHSLLLSNLIITFMIRPLNILLAENDIDLAIITKNFLVTNGFITKVCNTEDEVWRIFAKEKFDFLLIDTAISNFQGINIVGQIRKFNNDVPIILIGSNAKQSDIILGFKMGADDFIMRPFSMEELLLRIEAIKKRIVVCEQNVHIYKIGSYTLDTLHHVLIHNGKEKKLTSKELDLLFLFCEYKNRVVEREIALRKVWNQQNYFSARNMDVYIRRIRNMLCDDPDVQLENVHGVGYKLVVHNVL